MLVFKSETPFKFYKDFLKTQIHKDKKCSLLHEVPHCCGKEGVERSGNFEKPDAIALMKTGV